MRIRVVRSELYNFDSRIVLWPHVAIDYILAFLRKRKVRKSIWSRKFEARIDDDKQWDCAFLFRQKTTMLFLGVAWVEIVTAWKDFRREEPLPMILTKFWSVFAAIYAFLYNAKSISLTSYQSPIYFIFLRVGEIQRRQLESLSMSSPCVSGLTMIWARTTLPARFMPCFLCSGKSPLLNCSPDQCLLPFSDPFAHSVSERAISINGRW